MKLYIRLRWTMAALGSWLRGLARAGSVPVTPARGNPAPAESGTARAGGSRPRGATLPGFGLPGFGLPGCVLSGSRWPALGRPAFARPWVRRPGTGRATSVVAAAVLGVCVLAMSVLSPAMADERDVVLVLGDSLSAGYGLERDEGWVELLRARLRDTHPHYQVVNASISGDTSRGGQARLPKLLDKHRVAVAIVELGGNDGLRGIPLARTRKNLASIIAGLEAHGASVLLAGMQIPPNLGPRYTREFAAMYPQLAAAHDVALIPFLLDGIAGDGDLMQADGIHPTASAQPRMLNNVWPHLEPLL